jgi:hypothetical protein
MGKTSEEILASRPDDEQGYQDDPGFVVDSVVGKIEIPIVLCHTSANKTPKERVVILDADGQYRVHDYVMVKRVQGHEVAGDVWMLGQAAGDRLLAIIAGQLAPLPGLLGELLAKLLNKVRL